MSGYVAGKYCELVVYQISDKNIPAYLINQFDYLKTEFKVEEELDIFLNFKTLNPKSYIQTFRLIKNSQQNAYKGFYYGADGHIGHVEFKIKEALHNRDDNRFFIDFNELFRKFELDFRIKNFEYIPLFDFDNQTTSYHLNEVGFSNQQLTPELISTEKNFLSVFFKDVTDSLQKTKYKISYIKNAQPDNEGYLVFFEHNKAESKAGQTTYCNEIYFGLFEPDKQKKSVEWNNLSEKRILIEEPDTFSRFGSLGNIDKSNKFTSIRLNAEYKIEFKPLSLDIIVKTENGSATQKVIKIVFEKEGKLLIKAE
jgi:hypothetical protein